MCLQPPTAGHRCYNASFVPPKIASVRVTWVPCVRTAGPLAAPFLPCILLWAVLQLAPQMLACPTAWCLLRPTGSNMLAMEQRCSVGACCLTMPWAKCVCQHGPLSCAPWHGPCQSSPHTRASVSTARAGAFVAMFNGLLLLAVVLLTRCTGVRSCKPL